MSVNRRDEARSRLLQRARIVLNGGFTSVDCVVLDISEGGAKLRITDWFGIPNRFELRLPGHPPRQVEVRHRGSDSAGVRFIDG